jgi:hypothetical protein
VHDDLHRLSILEAARHLIEAARAERALLPQHAAEREFYLGVGAAAEEVVHPELGASRGERWLEQQTPPFRDGYLKTADMVASAKTLPQPPPRLPLPEPTIGSGPSHSSELPASGCGESPASSRTRLR